MEVKYLPEINMNTGGGIFFLRSFHSADSVPCGLETPTTNCLTKCILQEIPRRNFLLQPRDTFTELSNSKRRIF